MAILLLAYLEYSLINNNIVISECLMIIIFFLNIPNRFDAVLHASYIRGTCCPGFVSVAAEYNITCGLNKCPCEMVCGYVYITIYNSFYIGVNMCI